MKKIILLLVTVLVISACSQPKNVYFNGSEGSHSGIKYEPANRTFSLN